MKEKLIELSISKNYVSNWHLWEAMREILQNAIDADNQGHKMYIDYSRETETLLVFNEETYLPIETLVLGNTTKGDDDMSIGKYGEGYKLAIVVLLRLGYQVHISVGSDMWVPLFNKSKIYNTEVLCFRILKGVNKLNTNGTTFVIKGITDESMMELSYRCLPLYEKYWYKHLDVIHSEYGDILKDERFKGKFYVEGLYIQNDETFKYGYSFKNKYVDLDRDRRAINYYDLLELTTNTLISQTDDIEIVETSLQQKTKDASNLKSFYKEVSQEFATEYAKHFIEKHDIDEDTFVGTEKETKVSGSVKTYVTDEVQAKIVNKGLGKQEEYNKVKDLATQKDNKDLAWKYYKDHPVYKLHQWIKANCNRLSMKELNKIIKISNGFRPQDYTLIEQDVNDMLMSHVFNINPKFKKYIDRLNAKEDNNELI